MRRRTEITIETERTVFSEGSDNIRQTRWCKDCNAQTKHISLDEASNLLHLSAKHIVRLMGADCHQVNEKGTGNIFVCLNSLLVEVMLTLARKIKTEKTTYLQSAILIAPNQTRLQTNSPGFCLKGEEMQKRIPRTSQTVFVLLALTSLVLSSVPRPANALIASHAPLASPTDKSSKHTPDKSFMTQGEIEGSTTEPS